MTASINASKKIGLSLGLALCSFLATGCSPREMILGTVVSDMDNYFSSPEFTGNELEQHTDRVYGFRWGWYRILVVDTDEGLVVVDPMNPKAAADLKEVLNEKFPEKGVHTLIYSHYHLDHASGGAALDPAEIIAHRDCPIYWSDLESGKVLEPTRYIDGDQTLNIGGVEIKMILLPESHTNSIYAFHLPSEGILYTADTGLARAFPPNGTPDAYLPGIDTALEQLAQLDFDIFLPSHFAYGTKQDLIDYLEFTRYSWQVGLRTVNEVGHPGDPALTAGIMDAMYYPMKERYGDWHGFNQMILIHIFRTYTGALLGY